MSINNLNGLNLYTSSFLNSNVGQSYYEQSQDSLFGNNILSPNVNNFTADQNNSNSLLQILLPLLMSILGGQQNTQQPTLNNTAQNQLFAPVNNANIIQDQPVEKNHTQQNTKKSGINNARQDRLSVAVNNSVTNPVIAQTPVSETVETSTFDPAKQYSDFEGNQYNVKNTYNETYVDKNGNYITMRMTYSSGRDYEKAPNSITMKGVGLITKIKSEPLKDNMIDAKDSNIESTTLFKDGTKKVTLGSNLGDKMYDKDGKLTASYDVNGKVISEEPKAEAAPAAEEPAKEEAF